MLPRPRTADAAAAMVLAALATWVAERGVALAHGLGITAPSWRAAFALLGLHVAAVMLVLGIVGLVAFAGARTRRAWVAALVAAALALPPAAWIGHELAAGAWISRQWFAPLVAWSPAVVAAIGCAAAVRHVGRPGTLISVVLAVTAACAVVADATIAIGHDPAFHLGAYALATTATTLLALRLSARRARAWPWSTWLGAGAVMTVGALGLLRMDPATRAELLLRSPLAREVLRATTPTPTSRLLAELQDLDRAPAPVTVAPSPRGAVPLPANVSVLLVTIDALRADALPPVRAGDREHARAGDTPALDAFVASASAFRHAYAPASFTMRSIPAAFASRPATDDPEALGSSLPRAMAAAGRVPIAVVDRYFTEEPEGRVLLEGFEIVQVHASEDMRQGVGQLLGLVDQAEGRPFFAWMHLFATHAPGYAGRPLGSKDGSWPQRYRKSLRWVDRELARLLEGLRARGLDDTTIVILASDHGEGLGDNGVRMHGESVFEEEVRVPLAIRIPGRTGTTIDATVSLVDLPPTLLDLLDAPADPRHEGRSLVPLLADPSAPHDADVLTMSRRDTYALVRGRDKLVYDAGADAMLRFDLREDPTEDDDRFGDDPQLDRALRSAFVQNHPALFAAELHDPGTRALLLQRLQAIDPADPAPALPFLLQLTALVPDDELVSAAIAPFAAADDATRLQIVEHLLPVAPEPVGAAVVAHLSTLAGTAQETAFAAALARGGTPPFATEAVAERLRHWVRHGDPAQWSAWLRLVQPWPDKRWDVFGPSIVDVVSREGVPADVLRDALAAAAGLVAPKRAELRTLDLAARPHVAHADAGVRAAACTALTIAGGPDVLATLLAALARHDEDIRVRQACLKAAVFSVGDDAVPLVVQQAADPLLTFYAIRLLETLRSPAAIPFLQDTIVKERRGRIHAAASLALRMTLKGRPERDQ